MSQKENKASIAADATPSAASDHNEKSSEIAIVDERTIRDKIYEVRGVKVMLDFETRSILSYSSTVRPNLSGITCGS